MFLPRNLFRFVSVQNNILFRNVEMLFDMKKEQPEKTLQSDNRII